MIFLPKDRLRLLACLIGGAWPMIFAKAPEGFGSAECTVPILRDSGRARSVTLSGPNAGCARDAGRQGSNKKTKRGS